MRGTLHSALPAPGLPQPPPRGFRGEPASCPSHPYEDPSPTTSSGAARATFWDPAQSRSWPCPRANLSPAGPISPPGERRRGPGTPRPSHSTWLEDSVVQTPGQFHFLICLCSQKGGLEGSQPHPPSLALPTSARPSHRFPGWGRPEPLHLGCRFPFKASVRSSAWNFPQQEARVGRRGLAAGPAGRRKKRRALPSCQLSLRGSEGTGQDAGRAELRRAHPAGASAISLQRPAGRRAGSPSHRLVDTWLPGSRRT